MESKTHWRYIIEAGLPLSEKNKKYKESKFTFSNLLSRKWEVKTQHNHIGNITAM